MEREYLVLKDLDGILRPMAFCKLNDDFGQKDALKYANMEKGEEIVVVEIKEISVFLTRE